MSKRFIISTIFGTIVMLSFFIIKTLIIIGSVKTTFYTQWYEIDNLIRNGLKYNDSKSKIVHIYKEDNNTIVIEDNGRGMSKEEFEEYSKPYTRKEDQKEGGSGLGLNITIAIMKEHGFIVTSEKMDPFKSSFFYYNTPILRTDEYEKMDFS